MKEPKISVLLCVYNGEEYLEEAMDSILEQTYKNWECIVIDDCSSDSTPEILKRYADKDSRIKVHRNKRNLRLPGALNRALSLAEGIYVVRMDADDVCRKDRFEKQVSFMEQHQELALSCCRVMGLMDDTVVPANMQIRGDAEALPARFLFFNPIVHPGIIARKKDIDEFGYREKFSCTEDLDLWIRMLCAEKKMAVQNDYLLLYRQHKNQITVKMEEEQRKQYQEIIQTYYNSKLFCLTKEQMEFLICGIYYRDYMDLPKFHRFLQQIRKANAKRNKFSKKGVECAALDVILAYKEKFHMNKLMLLRTLLIFSPLFVLNEIIRRKRELYKSLNCCEEAAKEFALLSSGKLHGTQIPCYIKKQK